MSREVDPEPGSAVEPRAMIRGARHIHCSLHKCLTVYFRRVFERLHATAFGARGRYRHFDSRLDDFYREVEDCAVASVNNHVLDLDRFEDVRVTRFVRDPRDLVVSGYFYHRRAAERWCDVVAPTEADWTVVNGEVPAALKDPAAPPRSFASYLNEVSLEEGLLAEIEFRSRHFESLRAWPKHDDRIQTFRYEEIVGHETAIFDRIFRFYGFPMLARRIGLFYAHRFRASGPRRRAAHIRDPSSGQWREHFSKSVADRFDDEYGDLIEALGYPRH